MTRSAAAATLERVLAPHVVDQAVGGNDLVGAEEEGGEEGARLRPAEGNLTAPVPHLERPQDPELHAPASRPGTLTAVAALKQA